MESSSLEKIALIKLLTSHDVLDAHGIDIIKALSTEFINTNINELIESLEKKSDLYHIVSFKSVSFKRGKNKTSTIHKRVPAPAAKEYILKKIKKNLEKHQDCELSDFLTEYFELHDSNDIIPTITALSPTDFLNCIMTERYFYLNYTDVIHVCKTQDDLDSFLVDMSAEGAQIYFSELNG